MRDACDCMGTILKIYKLAESMNHIIAMGYSNDMIHWDTVNEILDLCAVKSPKLKEAFGARMIESFKDFRDLYVLVETLYPLISLEKYFKRMEEELSEQTGLEEKAACPVSKNELCQNEAIDIFTGETDDIFTGEPDDSKENNSVDRVNHSCSLTEEPIRVRDKLQPDRINLTALLDELTDTMDSVTGLSDFPVREESFPGTYADKTPILKRFTGFLRRLIKHSPKLPKSYLLPRLPRSYQELGVISIENALDNIRYVSSLPAFIWMKHTNQIDDDILIQLYKILAKGESRYMELDSFEASVWILLKSNVQTEIIKREIQ